ncbi:MAG TPA: cyclic nucleotide-binding domain-containing protein, partial [Actinomycetota bacterium]|nr:cyclic nucleotide-binding domain-containing protein [Actinomycetota bacterium]
LLVWMTLAAILFSILFFSLFLPFASAATERFPDADELAGFLGLFWAALTAAAFVVSMLLTNRLFAWVGVAAAVIVLPLLYSFAFGILLFGSGFTILVALRFAVGTWLQGVASPGWETLANVVPESRRDQVRAFLNGGPTQMGTVVAGLIALVGQDVLTARQFAAIGLVAAVVTVVATLGIRRSYTAALVDALRAGRPQVFEGGPRRTPSPIVLDADSTRALGRSVRSPDLHERRLAFQLLADLPPEARPAEVLDGVRDPDPIVRLAATRCLDVRAAEGRDALRSLLDDPDPSVAAAAAAMGLATTEPEIADRRLQGLLADRDDRVRRAAAEQLALAPTDAAARFGSHLLSDPVPEIRAIAVERVADGDPDRALEPALRALHDPDPAVRAAAGRALGAANGRALQHVLDALVDPGTTDAAIEAIRRTDADGDRDRIRAFVTAVGERAVRDRDLAAATPSDGEATALLHDAVLDRGRRLARSGLWAATILAPRRPEMETAIESLDGAPGQVANALETLESAGDPTLVRRLLTLWEAVAAPGRNVDWLAAALDDQDELIRACAELVRSRDEGGTMERSVTALSVMERVLFLRKVPLFADLSPADLERVAGLAEDHGYADAEVIAAEGEAGDELHIVVEGTIRVIRDGDGSEHELARRTTGDVVGEMSIVTQEPRMATLVAEGDVRTVTLGRREFESMLRERPSIALAVMRVLAYRIAEDRPSGDP